MLKLDVCVSSKKIIIMICQADWDINIKLNKIKIRHDANKNWTKNNRATIISFREKILID